MRMLIGYASRFGSTRDIAIRIADAVRTHGNEVDVRSVDQISDFDPYDAVVFGSGVYDGSWTVEATDLVRRHAAVLARKPVWLFSVGSFGDRHPIVGGLIKKEPKEIGEFEHELHPRDYRVFAGVMSVHSSRGESVSVKHGWKPMDMGMGSPDMFVTANRTSRAPSCRR